MRPGQKKTVLLLGGMLLFLLAGASVFFVKPIGVAGSGLANPSTRAAAPVTTLRPAVMSTTPRTPVARKLIDPFIGNTRLSKPTSRIPHPDLVDRSLPADKSIPIMELPGVMSAPINSGNDVGG